tara:strand:+ start:290 stop:571 length:282 start_codon:yes stop_codon:yes gene_type:complete
MKKNVNGVEIQMTEQEISERQARINNYNSNEFNRQLEKLREERNELLAETDFYALSDNTMSEAMTNYRQELRDITEGLTTVEDVEAVTFPTKP